MDLTWNQSVVVGEDNESCSKEDLGGSTEATKMDLISKLIGAEVDNEDQEMGTEMELLQKTTQVQYRCRTLAKAPKRHRWS